MSPITTGENRPAQLVCAPTTNAASQGQQPTPAINKAIGPRDLFSLAGRLASIVAGGAILAASTHAVIDANGLTGSDASLVAALALGVAAASISLPRVSRGMAFALVIAVLAGEGYGLLSSAERIVERREASAAMITSTNDARAAAQARLTVALAAQATQREMATEAVTVPSCARECRALLERQATDTANEVTAARAGLDKAQPNRSATPLADRLGIAPWAIDLLAAALLSIGANGLAATLIAVGSSPARQPMQEVTARPATHATYQPEHVAGMMHAEMTCAALADPTGTTLHMLPAPIPHKARRRTRATTKKAIRTAPALTLVPAAPSQSASDCGHDRDRTAEPAVEAAKAKIVALVQANGGQVKASVRGLAGMLQDVSKTTTATALAALVASGAVERAGDCIVLASRAA